MLNAPEAGPPDVAGVVMAPELIALLLAAAGASLDPLDEAAAGASLDPLDEAAAGLLVDELDLAPQAARVKVTTAAMATPVSIEERRTRDLHL